MINNNLLSKRFYTLFIALVLGAFAFTSQGQTIIYEDNTPGGTETFTVPAGVTEITVSIWGAGGGGGGGSANGAGGSGGGGGGASTRIITVTPGTVFSYVVGTGGTAGAAANGAGGSGTNTTITQATLGISMVGNAGTGGAGGAGTPGSGGAATGGTTNMSGGSGTQGGTFGEAGGNSGTVVGIFGAGGAAVADNFGNPGQIPGGGGGGGERAGANARAGGAGANGQVRITYAAAACVTPSSQPTVLILSPGSTTMSGSFTAPGTPPDKYLVVRNTSGVAPSPANGTTYTIGSTALGGTNVVVDNDNNTTFSVTGLTANTTYHFFVFSFNDACSGGPLYNTTTPLSGNSKTLLVYCSSNATSNLDTRITNVKFNTIDNTSPVVCETYTNYNGISTNVIAGTTYLLTFTGGTCGSNFTKYGGAWIDWNQNGTFDPAEQVTLTAAISPSTAPFDFTGNVTVPLDAVLGNTLMRVIVREGAAATACGTYTYGETEDYTINIAPNTTPPGCVTNLSPASATTLTCGSATTLSWSAGTGLTTGYKIYLDQNTTPTTLVSNQTGTSYATGTLASNTTYYWQVVAYNENGDATSCSIRSFTTATALAPPIAPDVARCGPGTVTLTASGGAYSNYNWYDTNTGGDMLHQGNSFTTPSLSSTTTYYVASSSVVTSAETSLNNGVTTSNCNATTANGAIAFNITAAASSALLITKLSSAYIATSGSVPTQVYYRVGTAAGFENTASGWIQIFNGNVAVAASGASMIDVSDFTIPAGQTYGIYIYMTGEPGRVRNAGSSNTNLTIGTVSAVCSATGGVFTGTANAGFALAGSVFYRTTTVGNCESARTPVQAIINPLHTITRTSALATTTQTVCLNSSITNITYSLGGGATGADVTGLPTGVTASVSGTTLTISGSPTVAGTFNFSVSTTGNACTPATASGTITVNPTHTITLTTANNTQTICSGNAIGNIIYSIGGGATGAGVTGLPSGVTGSFNIGSSTFTISGTPTVTGTFNYIVTTTGNSCPAATATGTITINANHTLNRTSAAGTDAQTICFNSSITNITYSLGGGATDADVTGLPAGVSASVTGTTLTVSGTPTETGIFNYSVTTTGNNCTVATASGTITINPAPTATAGGSEVICSGESATVSGASSSNGTILWTHNGQGSLTNVTTLTPTYQSVTADAGNTVTLTLTVSGAPCAPATASYIINVEVPPTATAGGSQDICVLGSATVSGATATNGTILWTHNGQGSLMDATTLTPTYTSDAADAGNTVTLTMTVTSNNACTPAMATASYTVNVKAAPTATAGGSATICETASYTLTAGEATASNGAILWTHNGAGSISSAATLTPTYTSAAGDAGNTVTLTLTVSNASCTPATASYLIIISPNANAGTVSGTTPLCIEQMTTYTSNGDLGGTWSSTNTGVATVDETTGVVTAVSAGTTDITYTINSGCNNPVSASKTLTVSLNANAGTVSGMTPLCIEQMTTYTSNGDLGGTWSSTNTGVATVDETTGVVTAVSAGTTNIIYTVGCNATAIKSLMINPNQEVSVSIGDDSESTICEGTILIFTATPTNGGTNPSYQWKLNGNNVGSDQDTYANPELANGDMVSVILTSNASCVTNNPATSNTVTIMVNDIPAAPSIMEINSTCTNCTLSGGQFNIITGCGEGTTLTYYSDMAGSNPTTIAPVYNQTTPMTIYYACVDDITGCRSAIQMHTTTPGSCTTPNTPTVGTIIQPTCTTVTGSAELTGLPSGSWTLNPGNISGNTTTYTVTGLAANTTYNFTVTNSDGCSSTASVVIGSNTTPPSAAVTPATGTLTCAQLSIVLTASGGVSYLWEDESMESTLTVSSAGTYTVTVTGSNGCTSTASAVIDESAPPANAGTISGNDMLCIGATASLSSDGDTGGTWSSSNEAVATVSASGVVNALSAGSTTISYTVSGCGVSTANYNVTVLPNAAITSVSGSSPLSINETAQYTANGVVLSGGTGVWSSSNTAIATVNSTGMVTAKAAGTVNIMYTITGGCGGTVSAQQSLTVKPAAIAEIRGNGELINNGSTFPHLNNHTDFGVLNTPGTLSRTFTIRNTGAAGADPLNIGIISISNAKFTVISNNCPGSLNPGESCTFTVEFDSGDDSGQFTADISVYNSDAARNPYTFRVKAEVFTLSYWVLGNNTTIPAGSTAEMVTSANHTILGSLSPGLSITRSYKIKNTGLGALSIGNNAIMIEAVPGYPGLAAFEIVSQPTPRDYLMNEEAYFSLKFTSPGQGLFYAQVTIKIENGDDFTFVIRGDGPTPKIRVTGNNVVIDNGAVSVSTTNFTDFGTRSLNTNLDRTFSISNPGSMGAGAPLNLDPIVLSGDDAAMFIVTIQPASTVSVNGNTSFRIRYRPTATGCHWAKVTITSNDPSNSPFTFVVRGNTSGATCATTYPDPQPRPLGSNVVITQTDRDVISGEYEFIKAYPNPAIDRINLLTPERTEVYTLEIMSAEGRSMGLIETNGGIHEIDISRYTPGIYYVRTDDRAIPFVRFIKLK
jgi:trimeric autotransporter adhesin